MAKIQLKNVGRNVHELWLGNGTIIMFSYETAVAARVPGRGYIRSAERYSKTTSKQLNEWLPAKHEIVSQEEIEALLEV